jgi:hypothetical protein
MTRSDVRSEVFNMEILFSQMFTYKGKVYWKLRGKIMIIAALISRTLHFFG